jgi:hypothetical protein
MQQKTKDAYIKLAANFYKTRFSENEDLTAHSVSKKLIECAADYRPAYWRRLRNALEHDQKRRGFDKAADKIKKLKNPLTTEGVIKQNPAVKPKQKRVKSVSIDEHHLIMQNVKDDRPLAAALYISNLLGCRPAELGGLELNNDGVTIIGVKKSTELKRGLDRKILLEAQQVRLIANAIMILRREQNKKEGGDWVHRLQRRLDTVTKSTFPKRKSQITLYSYRHQKGSDLKASAMDRVSIAYLMGHQSTNSVDSYGNRKTGSGRAILKPCSEGLAAAQSVIRGNHRLPPNTATPNTATPTTTAKSTVQKSSFLQGLGL